METEDRRRPSALLPRGPPAPLLRRDAGDPRSRGTKARRFFCLSVSLKDGAGDLLHSAALRSEELPHPSRRPTTHPQRAAPLATTERGKNGLPAADLPSVLRRASSPQPTSSSAPSGHDCRRPGCGPAAQLRPYGRTARFRQARSLEAEAAITPRCARRHRGHGKPTDPAHHHKGRCPLHPRVSGGFAPIAPSKGASPLCTPISAGALPPHPRARRWAGGQGAALCWDSVWGAGNLSRPSRLRRSLARALTGAAARPVRAAEKIGEICEKFLY